VVIPDRSGYGRSTSLDAFPADFHLRAAQETLALLDALGIEQAAWWGHSDGAVIAAMAAIHAPQRVSAAILEALHYSAVKPRSRAFFQRMASEPDSFGEPIRRSLAAEHGEPRWRTIVQLDGQAWLDLAAAATTTAHANLYDDRLSRLRCPTLVVHGDEDPRTEPGELDAIVAEIPHAQLSLHRAGGHSPHSAASSKDAVTAAVVEFLDSCHPAGS
jgi:pimeloyl-ACP methyl ester carboxylesterase